MASIVDICNTALGHLGDAANVQSINPPDSSAQARYCQRFYPIARDELLEAHAWAFATTRASLSQLTEVTTTAWLYQYQAPSDMLKPLSVYPEEIAGQQADDDYKLPYIVEERRILTNVPNAYLRYIKVVEDPTLFTPLFNSALSLLLAAYLAGPIVKGTSGVKLAQAMRKEAENKLAQAMASEANAANYKPKAKADWHSARGIAIESAPRSSSWRR